MAELNEKELEGVSGGSAMPCVVIGPYWGNCMRTTPSYNALCGQPNVFAEYVNTDRPEYCKYRLWRCNTAVGWTDRQYLQF